MHSEEIRGKLLDQLAGFSVEDLPRAWRGDVGQAHLRLRPEDFFVDEVLGFELSGEGEHLFVHIEKSGLNTQDVADILKRAAGVRQMDVGFAGMKDRRAVTRQWFSIHLPGTDTTELNLPADSALRILETRRHHRKLRRGALKGNRFRIVAREFEGDDGAAAGCLQQIKHRGFPNYFGVQRFGRNHSNLAGAANLFTGRARIGRVKRALYLSAARSFLFNQVLAQRVRDGNWNKPLDGEVFQLDGSRALFREDRVDETLKRRCDDMEIHPTGPLWGVRGRVLPQKEVAGLEAQTENFHGAWCAALERNGLEADRRACRAKAEDLEWTFSGGVWELSFYLHRGSYATSLLREWLHGF